MSKRQTVLLGTTVCQYLITYLFLATYFGFLSCYLQANRNCIICVWCTFSQ